MLRDVKTIVWKEFKEWFGSGRRSSLNLLIFVGVFGVLMPLQFGQRWLTSPLSAISWVWLPFLMVSATSADTIAGERERHTLESLFATRLPDSTIYLGKLTACVLYAVIQLWLIALLAVVTVNIVHWQGSVAFYTLPVALAVFLLPVIMGVLAGTIGTLVSMKAETSRAAQQSMTAATFALIIPLFIVNFLPETATAWLDAAFSRIDGTTAAVAAATLIIIADGVLFAAARRRFKRTNLAL